MITETRHRHTLAGAPAIRCFTDLAVHPHFASDSAFFASQGRKLYFFTTLYVDVKERAFGCREFAGRKDRQDAKAPGLSLLPRRTPAPRQSMPGSSGFPFTDSSSLKKWCLSLQKIAGHLVTPLTLSPCLGPLLRMGVTGLEPVTLRLSSACSNQLSYTPRFGEFLSARPRDMRLFQFPISIFQFPISNFQFPISNFQLPSPAN
jgi:hypothetical protein